MTRRMYLYVSTRKDLYDEGVHYNSMKMSAFLRLPRMCTHHPLSRGQHNVVRNNYIEVSGSAAIK